MACVTDGVSNQTVPAPHSASSHRKRRLATWTVIVSALVRASSVVMALSASVGAHAWSQHPWATAAALAQMPELAGQKSPNFQASGPLVRVLKAPRAWKTRRQAARQRP